MEEESLQEIELEMAVEECEELIAKLGPIGPHSEETTLNL